MILRFLGLFLPLKQVVWVRTYDGRVLLRRIKRRVMWPEGYMYTARMEVSIWDLFPSHQQVEVHWEDGNITKGGWYFKDWGEWRPWWNPLPPEVESRLIEINTRAKKANSGHLRKTRTLPQVWEQG